jgi:restriction endonuclease S subunit
MASDGWDSHTLGELTENFDFKRVPVKETDRRAGPYPYYGASGIVDHVDEYLFDGEYLLIAEDGENLRTRSTPVAFVARGRFWVNNHAHIVRANHRANTKFLMYALAGTDVSGYLTGSTMPKLTQGNMNRIPIIAPPIADQGRIAGLLGSLDDKIDLNRRMNETLEAMARALFKEWASRSHSPHSRVQTLIDQGVLMIGDGYRAKRIELAERGLPFARAGNLKNGFDFSDPEYLGEEGVAAAGHKVARPLDVAFTSKGTVGRITQVTSRNHTFVYSPQVCFWRILDHSAMNPYVLYEWMKTPEFLSQLEAVKGQTDMADFVSLTEQRRMSINLPGRDEQQELGALLKPFSERIDLNNAQNRTLSAIRDSLLPKLLSGEVRVKELRLHEPEPVPCS